MSVVSIGAYEAKTKLPDLLRKVQAGQEFVISVRGRAVAMLTPAMTGESRRQEAAAKMGEFMRAQQSRQAGEGLNLRELLEDGRA